MMRYWKVDLGTSFYAFFRISSKLYFWRRFEGIWDLRVFENDGWANNKGRGSYKELHCTTWTRSFGLGVRLSFDSKFLSRLLQISSLVCWSVGCSGCSWWHFLVAIHVLCCFVLFPRFRFEQHRFWSFFGGHRFCDDHSRFILRERIYYYVSVNYADAPRTHKFSVRWMGNFKWALFSTWPSKSRPWWWWPI